MENSDANRLPEADSLPDGFVESSAEPPAPLPADYKEALLDLDRSGETGEGSPAGTLGPIGGVDGEGLATSPGFLMGRCIDDYRGESLRDGILVPKPGSGFQEDSKETSSPRDGILMPSSLDESRGESQTSDTDFKGCTELHTTDLKERSVDEEAGPLKNQKENSEPKRKVVKRNIKSEKELFEFTLNYQKAIAERDAAVAVREKLESLCRELQRQNKMLMEECQRVSTEGQNMRQDLSTKFNDAIKDVSSKLEEQKDECLSQLRENDMLRDELKHLADRHALSEQHFSQMLKQKSLELQLADLKIQQHQEKSAQEQSQMQLYAEQVAQLMATEKSLRLQLAADGERFQQFQDALVKSNEVFEAFKQEMEKMAKLIKEFKKENEFLKDKCEKSDYALVKLVEERELMKKQLEKMKNQKEKLESLCRSLQAERKQNLVTGNPDSDSVQAKFGSSKEDS